MYKKILFLALFPFLLSGFVQPLFAQENIIFGPAVFKRSKGKPITEKITFTSPTSGTDFVMKIHNWDNQGKQRTSSGDVALNGVQIAGPSDFNQSVEWIERTISINATNEISVKLASPPGSFITITIVGQGLGPTVSISASPETIQAGESSTLSWSSSNAETAIIDQGIGDVPVNGSITVSPAQTTIYTITATGPGGTSTDSVTVTVIHPLPAVSISASPDTIQVGESATLSWASSNADSATINNGIGSVPVDGSITVSPAETTTYTITVNGPGGTATDSATVTVIHPPPTVSISANPGTIQIGESSVLSWNSTNADSCVIEPNIGSVGVNGMITISPAETTNYTITATGLGGTATANVTVTVTYPPPTVSISADPETIQAGESSTLTWNSTNADSAVIDQGIGSVAANGSVTVSPTETTTYTITVTGPGGTATASVTVAISPISISITSPNDGDTISRPDTMVQGTIINPFGSEIGVTVNGILAIVYGNQFVAKHVPLEEGENTITAVATDIDGNTATGSVTINAVTTEDYIKIIADTESGISPLETTLNVDGSFSFTESSISHTGPGVVEFLDSTVENEYNVRMTTPGIYFFTAEVTDDQSNTYTDTVAVQVLDQAELDALLRAKWDGMRNALSLNDIDDAIKFFDSSTKDAFRNAFSALSPSQLADIADELDNAQFIKMKRNSVEYDIRVFENDEEYSFYLLFIRGDDGLWKIRSF